MHDVSEGCGQQKRLGVETTQLLFHTPTRMDIQTYEEKV